MIDQTNLEQQAFGAALKPLAEAVTEIGKSKPLEHYTRDEILRLAEICVVAYQDFMLKILSEQSCDEEVSL